MIDDDDKMAFEKHASKRTAQTLDNSLNLIRPLSQTQPKFRNIIAHQIGWKKIKAVKRSNLKIFTK
jgi:hypothetical protein